MPATDIENRIEQRLFDAVPTILALAAENAGECTYARHLPGYLNALKSLEHLSESRIWGHDRRWREEAILTSLTVHHRAMYRQPCLICPACQSRSKMWCNAAYSMWGEPMRAEVKALHYEPTDRFYFAHL